MSAAKRSKPSSAWLPALTGAVAGLLLAAFGARASCTPRERTDARAPGPARDATAASRAAASAAPAPASRAPSADADAGAHGRRTAPAPTPAVELHSVPPLTPDMAADNAESTAALGGLERREVSLLADIERELRRDPPPEAHALLDELRRGAEREALIAYVQQRFPRDLPLRVVALRWVDRVRPAPGGTPARSPHPPGAGTGTPWLAPLGTKHR